MSSQSLKLVRSFQIISAARRGFHRSATLFEQPGIRWIAGSNRAPKYRKLDITKKEEELEPEYIKNDNYMYRFTLFIMICWLVRRHWDYVGFKTVRSEMELKDFLAAEQARLNN